MAHEVESMFFTGETPWHGIGHEFSKPPATVAEAMCGAGLDWRVNLEPVYTTWNGASIACEDARATVRATDGAVLGVVGSRFKPLQNIEAFETFQPFLDSKQATFETAGSLQGGRRVWVLAKMNRPDIKITKDDTIRKYILLSHGHDGTMSIHYGFTPIRVVCANTLAMARTDKGSALLKFRHTKNAKLTLDAVGEVINVANAAFEASAEQYKFLASKGISKQQLEKYVKVLFGVGEDWKPEDISTRTQNQMAKVLNFFENGRGAQLKGVKGTWWAAYNAATEYASHEAGHNPETRLNGLWFGLGADQNAEALATAVKMAA